jgi:LysM repeat protein
MMILIWAGYLCYGAWGVGHSSVTAPIPDVVPYYSPPVKMDLCGEAMPLDDPDVRERFDREFTIVVYSHAQVYLWLKRMERYLPWVESQLAENNLPDDLKYVAVAESDLMPYAVSTAGAAGPWQFMSSTGARYGLDKSKDLDERYDFELATRSAFSYLKDLYGLFNNWTLAIASYNCGENRIQSEIAKQRVNSYYSLKLPLETERYIFRIAAIKEILSHPERYGYILPMGSGYPQIKSESVHVNLPYPIPLQMVAEAIGLTYRDFKKFNPAFISDKVPEGSQTLKVPAGKGSEFNSRMECLLASYKPVVLTHKVARGETLTGIAAQYDISTQSLREWNQIQGDTLLVDQVLKIYK